MTTDWRCSHGNGPECPRCRELESQVLLGPDVPFRGVHDGGKAWVSMTDEELVERTATLAGSYETITNEDVRIEFGQQEPGGYALRPRQVTRVTLTVEDGRTKQAKSIEVTDETLPWAFVVVTARIASDVKAMLAYVARVNREEAGDDGPV